MNNHKFLKQKISKILKSVKYTIINKKMTDDAVISYIGQTERGLRKILMVELSTYIERYSKPIPINITVKGRTHGIVDINLNKIYPIDKLDKESFQQTLFPKICGYIETFVSDIKKDPKGTKTESYVDAVIAEYINLLDIAEAGIIKKQPEDSPIYGELEVIHLRN